MPDAGNKAVNIPWTPLLALLATLAGLTALLPSRSARPPAVGAELATVGSRGVSARLWQDPLQVANEAETRRKKEIPVPPPSGWSLLREEYNALNRPLVLMTCVPDSPYAEDVERRLRDRAAMHYALSAKGYVPKQSTALKYVLDQRGTVPFESFIPVSAKQQLQQEILAIWVGDGLLGECPLAGLAGIIEQMVPESKSPPEVRVLGPSNSGQYRKILREIEATAPSDETKRLLSRTRVYSCKATVAESVLDDGVGWLKKYGTTAWAIELAFTYSDGTGLKFERTVATDDQIYVSLINELGQRHIEPDAPIVVLSEMDSFYGRALVKTFKESIDSIAAQNGESKKHVVFAYTYMAGIDGALPKNALGVEERSEKDQGTGKEGNGSLREPTEGQSQIDYFRRLANMLAIKSYQEIAAGRRELRVVAVLGSDIYDKLQILRTLRPRLPGAIFITNGLDGRYGHPDEWDETRNLVVAASYPLNLDRDETPPFRDSTQVAVYEAARHALNPSEGSPDTNWKGVAQLFEIGRHGPVALEPASKPPFPWRSAFFALLSLLSFFLLTFLLLRGAADKPAESSHWWSQWLTRSAIAVPIAVVVSLGVTTWRFCSQTGSIEPFALYDGISIWPGDFVRLLVLLLAVHFVFKVLTGLDQNASKLAQEFGLPTSSPPARHWWSNISPHLKPSPSTGRVNVQALLDRYRLLGRPVARSLRTLILLMIYLVLTISILRAFPSTQPYLPVRGDAFSGSFWILVFAGILTLYVTFLVVDATNLNCLFIRDLDRGCSDWPPTVESSKENFKFSRQMAVLEKEDLFDYLDIQYIARRSEAVNKLVYYPFILIALLIAARWSETDGYPWPIMLIVLFLLNASGAVYCAIRLPIEARAARDSSLRRLRNKLFERRAVEAINPDDTKCDHSNSVALEAVIVEIEKLREGAFVGIWEQPLLRAILLPSGGVGLWALLDLLPR